MTDNVFLLNQNAQGNRTDFYLATIATADAAAGTATIVLDGMTEPSEKAYKALGSAWPLAADDRVVLLKQSGTYLILGRIGTSSGGGASPSSTTPKMDGTATAGIEDAYARGDHVHPTDTSRAAAATAVTGVAYDETNHKITKTINGSTTDVAAVDTTATTNSTNLITSGAVRSADDQIRELCYRAIYEPALAFAIPAEGNSVTISDSRLKDDHELLRWNFSESPENRPPVKLKWETADGSCTITNLGGITSEKIRPVFGYVF